VRKIVVVGSGYVGMSLATLLAQKNRVVILDIDQKRVDMINRNESPIVDSDIAAYLSEKTLSIEATLSKELAYERASLVIIATPTDYDPVTNKFNTSSVDSVVDDALAFTKDCLIVIKSTLPVGHTKSLQLSRSSDRIVFSPEFLREGQALKDNLYPSRIIVGCAANNLTRDYVALMEDGAEKNNIEILFMDSTEAESVKLFSNAYLAMRVSFFNELDSYAIHNNLDVKSIIDGVCLDQRIGRGYCNPSFGYGGYCFPKDTKQLLAGFVDIPQALVQAIVESNDVRKTYLAEQIISRKPSTVGIYRLIMKTGSDNFRSSSVQDIISLLLERNIEVILYEPTLVVSNLPDVKLVSTLNQFKQLSDVIVANRTSSDLQDVTEKVFSRDVFLDN